jgi:hypothetical protein
MGVVHSGPPFLERCFVSCRSALNIKLPITIPLLTLATSTGEAVLVVKRYFPYAAPLLVSFSVFVSEVLTSLNYITTFRGKIPD